MNILQIIEITWNSGVTNYAMELSKGLSRKGHKVFFAVVKNGAPLQIAKENGFRTIEICSRKSPFIFSSISRIKNLVESQNIDIVNVHTGKAHLLAYITSFISNKKFAIIRTKADVMPPKRSFVYKKTDRIIAASEFIKKQYLKIGLPTEKVVIVYQGVVEGGRWKVEGKVVGMLARLDPVKGHRYFLEAAVVVLKKFPEAKFLVAGKEENVKYGELKELSKKLGIQKSVEFLGYVLDIYGFMSRCSVGVIASTGSEAVSRVLLEWMACDRPVVATAVGCIPEILDDRFLVSPCNSEQLAEKIVRLLQDNALAENAAKTNREKIEKRFNLDRFISETEQIYESAYMRDGQNR